MKIRSAEQIQENVPIGNLGLTPSEDQVTAYTDVSGSGGGLSAVIRLRGTSRNYCVCFFFQGIGDQELEFTCFVSSLGKARLVVSFD